MTHISCNRQSKILDQMVENVGTVLSIFYFINANPNPHAFKLCRIKTHMVNYLNIINSANAKSKKPFY